MRKADIRLAVAGHRAYEELDKSLTAAMQPSRAAKIELVAAERFAQIESAWQRLSRAIHETRNLAAAWEGAGPEERPILLDYWVLAAVIVVEPIPNIRRANQKTAIVTTGVRTSTEGWDPASGRRIGGAHALLRCDGAVSRHRADRTTS